MPEAAHVGIQWKGTDVCMDVFFRCCGIHVHYDGYVDPSGLGPCGAGGKFDGATVLMDTTEDGSEASG